MFFSRLLPTVAFFVMVVPGLSQRPPPTHMELQLSRMELQLANQMALTTSLLELESKIERKIEESLNPLEESIRLQKEEIQKCTSNTQIEAFKNTFLPEQGGMSSPRQCSTTQELNAFQDRIIEVIDKATQDMLRKILLPQCQRMISGSNCKEVLDNGCNESGVYTITPKGFSEGVKVYCDQVTDGGGWTVMLQRKRPAQVNFSRSFEEYAAGFGNPNGELWIGNRVLHSMTGDKPFTLRVEATGVEGQYSGGSSEDYAGGSRYGIWETFSVGSEDTQFRLSIGGYSDSSSTLGDALTGNPLRTDNNMQFSTYDRDNDRHPVHCSVELGNYGWWINNCGDSTPTGQLVDTILTVGKARWDFWKKRSYTRQLIKEIQFKIRP